MIDVDVVKSVDEDYARTVHGVQNAEIDCFALGYKAVGNQNITLAKPVRDTNIAISFTQSLAEFFYEFAEKHFLYSEGDEVLLLSVKIDCNKVLSIPDYAEQVIGTVSENEVIIIKRRNAISSSSQELKQRIWDDIYRQHEQYQSVKSEDASIAEQSPLQKAG